MTRVGQVWSNEGVLVREAADCILCGKGGTFLYNGLGDRLFGAPGIWSLMECRACSLCWLNPRPLASEVWKLYASYYTHQLSRQSGGLKGLIRSSVLGSAYGYAGARGNTLLGWMFAGVGPIRELIGGHVLWLHARERGKLLDVGCGNGAFLAHMRNLGWEVAGVEPDPAAVQVAREVYDIDVFCGTLEEAPIPEESFDVVTMNHVLEHVPDPIMTLTTCRRVLRSGGKVVIVTPNVASLGARVWRQYWRGWEVPRHLFVFSPKSLSTCAQRAGLTVQELQTVARGARWTWVTSSLIRKDGKLPGDLPPAGGRLRRFGALVFWLVEYLLSRRWNVGEELVLVARK